MGLSPWTLSKIKQNNAKFYNWQYSNGNKITDIPHNTIIIYVQFQRVNVDIIDYQGGYNIVGVFS